MRAARLLPLGLLLLLAAVPTRAAQTPAIPSLHVELPPAPPGGWTVGDRIAVELVLTADADLPTPPRFPAWEESWGEAEIVETGEVREDTVASGTAAGQAVYRQRVVLAVFRPGTVPLPPQEVAVPAAAPDGATRHLRTADDLALEIASVLPAPAEEEGAEAGPAPIPDPKPARPPQEIPVPRTFWLSAVPLAVLAGLLGWLLWRRHRRLQDAADTGRRPDLPPRQELDHGLAAARAESDPAAALARVSLALRRYLGRRLGFPAAESTSREIRGQLRGRRLDATVTRRCDELLAACDLVKFARRPASAGDVERWAATAAAIADGVERHLRPAEAAGETAADSSAPSAREAA